MKDACVALFKHMPEEMALKCDAFVTAGLPGALRMAGQGRPTKVKSEIRAAVLNGLREYYSV
jgi:hypothetical protein